jgi:hypothetical protein
MSTEVDCALAWVKAGLPVEGVPRDELTILPAFE